MPKRAAENSGAAMHVPVMPRRAPARSPAPPAARESEPPEGPAGSATLRALLVLEAIAGGEEPLTLDDVARTTKLSKPTAFRILRLLEESRMLVREPGAKRYAVGHRFNALAWSVLRNARYRAERHAILQRLVADIGETCNVAMLDGRELIYLDRVETSSALRLNLAPGSRVPLHCTSGGKLFLSRLPRSRWERLLGAGPLERHTPHTLTDRDAIEQELLQIRRQGWSADREELLVGIVCLAVPVLDRDGEMLATLALQAPLARMTHEQSLAHLGKLRAAATALAGTFKVESPERARKIPRKPKRP